MPTPAEILESALAAYYASKNPPVSSVGIGIRQDLGIPLVNLGYGSDQLTTMDNDAATRAKVRSSNVVIRLRAVAGTFAWWEDTDIVPLAADAIRFFALADMAQKAIRISPEYQATVNAYFKQAEAALKDAASAISDALTSGDVGSAEPDAAVIVADGLPPSRSVRFRVGI